MTEHLKIGLGQPTTKRPCGSGGRRTMLDIQTNCVAWASDCAQWSHTTVAANDDLGRLQAQATHPA